MEGIRVLTVVRQFATKATTQALNQIRSLVSTAPDELREQLRSLTIKQTVATCAAYRPRAGSDVETVSKVALRDVVAVAMAPSGASSAHR